MNLFSMLVLVLLSNPNLAHANAQIELGRLWKKPSEKLLSVFKKACSKNNQIDFDGGSAGELIPLLQKKADVPQIRALIYAEANCSDGASRERLLSALGNEILIQHPSKLIEALYREKRTDLGSIVEQENNDWFATECEDDKCSSQRKSYFAKKRSALSNAKVKKEWEAIRKDLLAQLYSDK